jgi:hypothetical protein
MPFTISQPSEYLEFNGVPLSTPAWEALDLSPAYDAAPLRGEDRLIPEAQGRRALHQIVDELSFVIPLAVWGFKDWDDNEYADPMMGLLTNLEFLKANVFAPNPSAPYTWAVRHFRRDGSVTHAQGKAVPPFSPLDDGFASVVISVEILIPDGEFTEGS